MTDEKSRLWTGAFFGFLQSLLMAFSIAIPAFYFNSIGVSLVVYAFLLSIGDVISFLSKPIIGNLTDKFGEKNFLIVGVLIFVVSLFLLGQTTDVLLLTILKILSGVAGAILFVVILIYGLRKVKVEPDKKVGFFGGIKSSGWIFGLLIPGIFISTFGIGNAFNLILVIGLFWLIATIHFARKYGIVEKIKVKPSFAFIKKIPVLMIYKTMDLAMFSTFLFFFIRVGLKDLGLTAAVISIVLAIENVFFAGNQLLLGKISNKNRRKYWVPLTIVSHLIAAWFIINANSLMDYILGGIFIGIAGGFMDVWIFSKISEDVEHYNKGKFIGTFGWSYDFATIIGAQLPLLIVAFGLNQFSALFVYPFVILLAYLLTMRKKF